MTLRRIALLTVLSALGVLGFAASASAATICNPDIPHNQTNFPPGGKTPLWFNVNNVGPTASSVPITLTVKLPTGLTRAKVGENATDFVDFKWSCPGSAGDSSFTCTTSGVVPRHRLSRRLILVVDVAPTAEPLDRTVSAKLKGGGAAKEAAAKEPIHIDPQPAGFGILPESFVPDFFQADGLTVEREAGAHPDLATFPFDLNSVDAPEGENFYEETKVAAESVRDLKVDLPPGFVGAPTAVGECTPAVFTFGECPPSSQVGRFDATLYALGSAYPFY